MGIESAYQLGTRVTASDYLYRVEARGYYYEERRGRRALDLLAEHWPQALDRSSSIPAKIWIPASVHRRIFDEHGIYLRCDTRRHPTPSRYSLTLPVAGIICGKVTLQDGTPDYDESGSSWTSARRYTGYRVAYHLSRRPLTVLPSMIQAVP